MPKRITYNSPVVLTFSLISLAALITGGLTDGYLTEKVFMLYLTSASDPMQYVRLFTHVLGHADWAHYSGNIMLLLLVGPMLEEKYGSLRLLTVMLFTSLSTAFINLLLFPELAVLGASGIVFAFILLTSMAGIGEGEIPLTLIVVAAVYLGGEVISGIAASDSVSQLSHVMGGVTGCLFGYLFIPKTEK